MAKNNFKIPSIEDLKPAKPVENEEPQSAVTAKAANPFNSPLANPVLGLNAKDVYYVPVSDVNFSTFTNSEQYIPVTVIGEDGQPTTVYKTPEEMKEYNKQKEEAANKALAEKQAQAEHEALIKEQEQILLAEQERQKEEAIKKKIFEEAQQKVRLEAQQKAQHNETNKEDNDSLVDNLVNTSINTNTNIETDIDDNVINDTDDEVADEVISDNFKPACYVSPKNKKAYKFPPLGLLDRELNNVEIDYSGAERQKVIIDEVLKSQHFGGHVEKYVVGPTITQFQILADMGVRVETILSLERTLQASLAAQSIRILSPVPGSNFIGIEIPSAQRTNVKLGDLFDQSQTMEDHNPFRIPLGKNSSGEVVFLDFQKVYHLLVAGMTGSGKSVCLNAIICSLLYKATPEDIKLLIIDPKRNEFIQYANIPHLACPIIMELDDAIAIFKWLVQEMENRSKLFCAVGARDITRYNELSKRNGAYGTLPHIIVVFDEFGDYIMKASKDFEDQVTLLGQKARSYGIHLVLATQRPSKDIIAGSIKSNLSHTICFTTKDFVSSNVIIGHSGGEKLLGNGDMIYVDQTSETRVQGAYLSDDTIDNVSSYVSNNNDKPNYMTDVNTLKTKMKEQKDNSIFFSPDFINVSRYVVANKCASSNKLTQIFGYGFNRVNAVLAALEQTGVITSTVPGKQREVLMDEQQLEQLFDELGVLH